MITSYKLFLEQLLLEYKTTPTQELMFKKWLLKKKLITDLESTEQNDLMNRFFTAYPKLVKKDVNSYRTLEELKAALDTAESFQTFAEKKKQVKKDAEKATFGDKTVVLTFTPESSQFYGGSTTWCTAMKSSVYHWLLHRIIGVEFYVVSDTPNADLDHKLSIHINWNKRYSTAYNADNTCLFAGVQHEYTDIEDLRKYLNNDEMFNWIMTQFELTKKDAPKFIPKFLNDLCDNDDLVKMFNKYNYFVDATDDVIYNFNDELNSSEFDYMNNNLTSTIWFEGFKQWFKSKTYDSIVELLDQIEDNQVKNADAKIERLERLMDKTANNDSLQDYIDNADAIIEKCKKVSLDDHVFISETFKLYIKERANLEEEYGNIPVIFEPDDEDWLEFISGETDIDYDELEEDADDIYEFYLQYPMNTLVNKNHVEMHKKILKDFYGQ